MIQLDNQIMDELMDQPMTIASLSDALASGYENTRRRLHVLERKGLVYAHSAVQCAIVGRPQIMYDMVRTIRRTA